MHQEGSEGDRGVKAGSERDLWGMKGPLTGSVCLETQILAEKLMKTGSSQVQEP